MNGEGRRGGRGEEAVEGRRGLGCDGEVIVVGSLGTLGGEVEVRDELWGRDQGSWRG